MYKNLSVQITEYYFIFIYIENLNPKCIFLLFILKNFQIDMSNFWRFDLKKKNKKFIFGIEQNLSFDVLVDAKKRGALKTPTTLH